MPTYQYRCTNPDCGNEFELVQTFTEPAASQCPVCGQAVRKVYGSVGVVFKGSGFYRNDSRSEGKGGKDALSPAGKDSGSKDSGSKDAGSKESSSTDSSGSKDSSSSKDSNGSSSSKDSKASSSTGSGGSSSGASSKGGSSAPAAASK